MNSRIITVLGVVASVVFATAPEMMNLNPTLARYLMLLGVAASAAGRELITPAVLQNKTFQSIALFVLTFALVLPSVGCGLGKNIVKYSDTADRTVTRMADSQVIDQADADQLHGLIKDVRAAGVELQAVEQIIADSKEAKATKAEKIRAATRGVISALRRLESEGILRVKNPNARLQLQRALAIAETILEFTP